MKFASFEKCVRIASEFKLPSRPLAQKHDSVGTISIYEPIGADLFFGGMGAKQVVDQLDGFKQDGVTDLEIRLNSPGGDSFDAHAILSATRRMFGGNTTVYVDGLAASAASIVMMAGDRIIAGKSSRVMVHEPWSIALGDSEELRAVADRLDQERETMVDLYAEHTGLAKKTVREMLAAETWMNAQEALDNGFIHEIANECGPDGKKAKEKRAAMAEPLMAAFALTERLIDPDEIRLNRLSQNLRASARKTGEPVNSK